MRSSLLPVVSCLIRETRREIFSKPIDLLRLKCQTKENENVCRPSSFLITEEKELCHPSF
jgi:hypothetical protein